MAAIIKQFEGSMVSPKDDAVLHRIFNEESGVIRGCGLTYLGANQIRVDAGYVYILGRLIEIEEEVVLSPFSAEEEAEGELVLRVDLLSDIPARLLARTPRQELVQEDINSGGEIYEYLIASYTVSDVAISGLTIEYEVISAGFSKDKILTTVDQVAAVTEEGFLADALVVKALNANLGGITFGFTEDGQPGYVTMGEDGADAVIPFSTIVRIGVGYDSQPFTQNYKNLHMATGQADYYVYKHNGKNTWIPYKVGTIVTMDVFAGDVISFTVGANGPARPYTAWIGQTDGVVLIK